MRNRIHTTIGAAALVLVTGAGCADTEIQGVILDEDLNTPDLMLGMARGTNSEFGDLFLASVIQYYFESATDGVTNDGTAGSEIEPTVGDYTDRPQSSTWAQAHEAVWAVFYTDNRMKEVLPPEEYETSPLLARNYIYGGHAERILGEAFCEVIYNYGKDGGILLGDDGGLYDPSQIVSRDSAFKRAIYMHETALQFAEAALAAGREAPDDDPLFDPQLIIYAAHAGMAQNYANLGDWATAVQHARMVPDDFSDWAVLHGQVDGGNYIADLFYQNDDLSIYRTPAALLWPDDPRVGLVKCGDWAGPNRDMDEDTPPRSAFVDLSSGCGNLDEEYRSESNRYPLWISDKYPDDDADVEIASGAEMRLIEAEAALLAGNLGEFTAQVNRARAVRGVDPIVPPTSVGALEYPNAQDDAWSILDRERYLENFLEGRRMWDLDRWDHPFVTENHVLLPRLVNQLPVGGRGQCLPIPDLECDANAGLNCPVLGGG